VRRALNAGQLIIGLFAVVEKEKLEIHIVAVINWDVEAIRIALMIRRVSTKIVLILVSMISVGLMRNVELLLTEHNAIARRDFMETREYAVSVHNVLLMKNARTIWLVLMKSVRIHASVLQKLNALCLTIDQLAIVHLELLEILLRVVLKVSVS